MDSVAYGETLRLEGLSKKEWETKDIIVKSHTYFKATCLEATLLRTHRVELPGILARETNNGSYKRKGDYAENGLA